ncbi:hypothetical protein ACFX12_037072 [Malus domestica]
MLKQRMRVAAACAGHFTSGVPILPLRHITSFASTERCDFPSPIPLNDLCTQPPSSMEDFMANQCQSLKSLTY